jgi:hypothetical protein
LLAHAEEAGLLHEAQNAFRPGRSTDQHICTLSQTAWERLRQGKATYAFFLDLKKAYDTACRDGLMFRLCGTRASAARPGGMCAACMPPPPGPCASIGQLTSDWFDIDLGTGRADTRSCILLAIFVDDLLREVEAASQGVPLQVRPAGAPCQTQD